MERQKSRLKKLENQNSYERHQKSTGTKTKLAQRNAGAELARLVLEREKSASNAMQAPALLRLARLALEWEKSVPNATQANHCNALRWNDFTFYCFRLLTYDFCRSYAHTHIRM